MKCLLSCTTTSTCGDRGLDRNVNQCSFDLVDYNSHNNVANHSYKTMDTIVTTMTTQYSDLVYHTITSKKPPEIVLNNVYP